MSSARSLLYVKPLNATDMLSGAIASDGWDVHVASPDQQIRDLMKEQDYRVGLFHWDGASENGMRDQIRNLHESSGCTNWVALLPTQWDSVKKVRQVIHKYFYDYHTLPLDVDRLLVTLGHAYGMAEIAQHSESEDSNLPLSLSMIGQTPRMREMYRQIRKVAAIDVCTLIRGESGTGKELCAQAIHKLSDRADKPLVAVNCGALPKDLIQSELFGHEKGSFTGAQQRRAGLIEAANGGTLFLDEIGDLPQDLQVNLLRFLQEKIIMRVGGSTAIPVDVRVIAATHVDLEKAVEQGSFREDLYYRLNVLHLETPPLRERSEDIELLAQHFFSEFSRAVQSNSKGFTRQAIAAMNRHSWPGNVRELVNRIQRAVVMCESNLIDIHDLSLDKKTPNGAVMTLAQARAQAEKQVIVDTLKSVRNNVSMAARRLGISRVTLYRLMEQHRIDWQTDRNNAG